jgi:LPS-assembly lipoprotein
MIKKFYPGLIFVIILLTSCGFHLRNIQETPKWLNNIAIIVHNAHDPIKDFLEEQSKNHHIKINLEASNANYWLIIEDNNFQQNISSISSSTTARQYQLIYSVRFKLQQKTGKELISSRQIIINKQITINGNHILGSTNELEHSKLEMQSEAANQIIDSLGSVL